MSDKLIENRKEELRQWIREQGVIEPRVERLVNYFYEDKYNYHKTTEQQKEWAYERGFCSEKIFRYGINDDNYTDYMPDIEYHTPSAYKNRRFSRWYDDKVSTWYVLAPYKEYMPEHYFVIDNGNIRKLHAGGGNNNAEAIIELLKEKKILASKPARGGHGEGFKKLEYRDEKFFVSSAQTSETELKTMLENTKDSMITEFSYASGELLQMTGGSPVVLRMVLTYDAESGSHLTAAAIRLGCKKWGDIIDYDGTFWCGLTLEEGEIFDPRIVVGSNDMNELVPCDIHPDSNERIEGKIKNWKEIKEKLEEIGNYLNMTPWLTLDVVAEDDGFKILEINSHGMVRYMQPFYPTLANEYNRKLFGR